MSKLKKYNSRRLMWLVREVLFAGFRYNFYGLPCRNKSKEIWQLK